jgi:hypothetical protein
MNVKRINKVIKLSKSICTSTSFASSIRQNDLPTQSRKMSNMKHQSGGASIELNSISHHIYQHFRNTFNMEMSDSLPPSKVHS